jgi:hypothetical protein
VAKQVATGVAGCASTRLGAPAGEMSATTVNGDLSAGAWLAMQPYSAAVTGASSWAHIFFW